MRIHKKGKGSSKRQGEGLVAGIELTHDLKKITGEWDDLDQRKEGSKTETKKRATEQQKTEKKKREKNNGGGISRPPPLTAQSATRSSNW